MASEIIGSTNGLHFELIWDSANPVGSAATATRGSLRVAIGEREVWPLGRDGEPTWPWIEMLEFLASRWIALVYEIGADPLGLGEAPTRLVARAEEMWRQRGTPNHRIEREEERLDRYLRDHDLSSALLGAFATSCFIFRRGVEGEIYVGADLEPIRRPWAEIESALVAIGDVIAARASDRDDRARAAVHHWRQRSEASDARKLAAMSGWREPDAARFLESANREVPGAAFLGSRDPATVSFALAARMIGPDQDMNRVVSLLRPLLVERPRIEAPALHRLRDEAPDTEGEEPFVQGALLATWLRSALGIDPGARVDPDAIVAELGVVVEEVRVDRIRVDAVCALGQGVGPIVVVNALGPRARGNRGYRATVAHELCHLLVDLEKTLPIAEAKAHRAPQRIEARANAFAAELLMPKVIASAELVRAVDAESARALVDSLCRKFGTSRSIVAWQSLNANVTLAPSVVEQLKLIAFRWIDRSQLRSVPRAAS